MNETGIDDLQAVEKIQQLISPWSPEQQQCIEILVDEISFAAAAINSLVIRPGSFDPFNYRIHSLFRAQNVIFLSHSSVFVFWTDVSDVSLISIAVVSNCKLT